MAEFLVSEERTINVPYPVAIQHFVRLGCTEAEAHNIVKRLPGHITSAEDKQLRYPVTITSPPKRVERTTEADTFILKGD